MTKKSLAVLVVLLLAATVGLVAGCGGNLPKGAVAKVGGTIITQKAFDARVADFEAQYAGTGQIPDKTSAPDQYKDFQRQVLDYMITYEVANQAAKDLKVAVADADVQKEIDSVLSTTFGGDQTKFDDALKQQGITLDQLKNSYRESMLLQKVYEEVTKNVTTVADKDIQAYYDAHKSSYYVAETRTARHILLTPVSGRVNATTTTTTSSTTSTTSPSTAPSTTTTSVPSQADWDSALAAAKLVRAQLVAGADWTIEAKMYSDDPGSKATGGDLGSISKGEMVKEFEDAVFSLKKDEVSEPVKTAYGYHIIQVTGITEAKQSTLEEVKAQITSTVLTSNKSKTWQNWVDAQKLKVGVVYASEWVPPTTTTTAAPTATTSGPADTTTTTPGAADTTSTAAPSSDTTAAPATTTTTTAGTTLTTSGATTTVSQ